MSATDYSPANGHAQRLDGAVTPPQNLEAEQSVLGAVLLSDTALPALIIDERLQPGDFYRESHGLIFTAMLALHGAGEPVDALTLVEHLKQNGQLDAVGGRATVDLLAGSVPAVGNVRQYARIVRENAMLRRLLRASHEIQAREEVDRRAAADLLEQARLLEVLDEREGVDGLADRVQVEHRLEDQPVRLAVEVLRLEALVDDQRGQRGVRQEDGAEDRLLRFEVLRRSCCRVAVAVVCDRHRAIESRSAIGGLRVDARLSPHAPDEVVTKRVGRLSGARPGS